MPDIKSVLAELTKQIDATLNPPATTSMTADEFTTYAKEQVEKLGADIASARKDRAAALKAAIEQAQSRFEKGDESLEIVKFSEPSVEQPAPAPASPAPVSAEPAAAPVPDLPEVDVAKTAGCYWPEDLNDPSWRKSLAEKK